MTTKAFDQPSRAPASWSETLDSLRRALEGLRYGEVTLVVQDGVIVQVNRTERLRLARKA